MPGAPKKHGKEEKPVEVKQKSSIAGKGKESRGKKKPRETDSSKKWTHYEIVDGKLKRKNRACPKCGAGIFMAHHKDRWTCGKCQYTEYIREAKK